MSSHERTLEHYAEKTQALLGSMPDYVLDFMEGISGETSERTQYEYTLDVRRFLNYLSRELGREEITVSDLDQLTEAQLQGYMAYLSCGRDGGKDTCNGSASIKRKFSAVRRFLKYLYQSGQIGNTEIQKIRLQRIPAGSAGAIRENELKQILALISTGNGLHGKQKEYHALQSARDMAIIMLILSSGIRVSECNELDMADVDMQKGRICVVRGEDEISVSFSDETAGYLMRYIRERASISDAKDPDALFLSSRKTRISTRAIENIVKKYARLAIPGGNITPHTLRATCASRLYEAVHDITAVAESLGYKDIRAAKKYYKE